MPKHSMQNPVIVMGMARSGTTLIAEMLHTAGTSMFAQGMNPSYDGGNKYERVSCQDINLEILGVKEVPAISTVRYHLLRDISEKSLATLSEEVGTGAWGFKDPRTMITYAAWRKVFSGGPVIYTYRNHGEVMRHYFRAAKNHSSALRRPRRALRAWIFYNQKLIEHFQSDTAAGRRVALVRYEELMEQNDLIARLQEAVEVPLQDARNPNLRRNKESTPVGAWENFVYRFATAGQEKKVQSLYETLGNLRLSPD